MFIRKLFKIGDKAKWLALELVIVFIGVYLAFLFQNYNETVKVSKERDKVFKALKYELEAFRVKMPGMSSYMYGRRGEYLAKIEEDVYVDFADWRFIEPQYEYKIVEYAINLENTEIVDFQLYDRLQALYTVLKRLEHAERLMMETAQNYRGLPLGLASDHSEIRARHIDNMTNFKRLVVFMGDRAGNLQRVAQRSEECLELINAEMDQGQRKEIESELIASRIDLYDTIEAFVEDAQKAFPDFSKEEVESIYKKAKEGK